MEVVETDITLITNGILMRDDSHRIADATQNAQQYQSELQASLDQANAIILTVQRTVNDTFTSLQNFLTASMQQIHDIFMQAQQQAMTAAVQLETILSNGPQPIVTQEDINQLDTQVQEVTGIGQDALNHAKNL
jgi:hypothetical protein